VVLSSGALFVELIETEDIGPPIDKTSLPVALSAFGRPVHRGNRRVRRSLRSKMCPLASKCLHYTIKKRCPAFLQLNTVVILLSFVPASFLLSRADLVPIWIRLCQMIFDICFFLQFVDERLVCFSFFFCFGLFNQIRLHVLERWNVLFFFTLFIHLFHLLYILIIHFL